MTRTYVAPTSLDDALAAIAAGARPVAGGTDLVVGARQGKAPLPDHLLAIHQIHALRGIVETDGGGLRLGALATHEEIVAHPVIRERFAALADASAIVGSHATRAQGTIGGNVMNASPAMDAGGPLLCFDGAVTLRSARGERSIPIADLWSGPGTTAASADELLVSVDLPGPASGTGSCYVRLEYRRQMEIAVVGATAVVTLDDERRLERACRDHGARADDPTGAGRGAGADRLRRRRRGGRGRGPRDRRGVDADQRRPRFRRVSPRDGRGHRPPGGRRRPRPRAW